MKLNSLLMALLVVGISGCDFQQDKLIQAREQFEKDLRARDKTIHELNRRINDLDQRNGQLEQRLIQESAQSPDKLAAVITERVSRTVAEQNAAKLAEVKAQVDEVLKTIKTVPASTPVPVTSASPSPSAKKIKLGW